MSDSQHFEITPDNIEEVQAAVEAAQAEARGETVTPDEETETTPEETEEEQTQETQTEEPVEDLEIKPKEEVAEETSSEEVKINLDSLAEEYAEHGSLTEETTAKVVEALQGVFDNPQQVIDQYFAGLQASTEVSRSAAFEITGGEQGYRAMTEWAAENLSEAELARFNKAVVDPEMMSLAVSGLHAQFQAAKGSSTPSSPRVNAGPTVTGALEPITSDKQVADLVSSDQYQLDAGYRQTVDARIKASMEAGLLK